MEYISSDIPAEPPAPASFALFADLIQIPVLPLVHSCLQLNRLGVLAYIHSLCTSSSPFLMISHEERLLLIITRNGALLLRHFHFCTILLWCIIPLLFTCLGHELHVRKPNLGVAGRLHVILSVNILKGFQVSWQAPK